MRLANYIKYDTSWEATQIKEKIKKFENLKNICSFLLILVVFVIFGVFLELTLQGKSLKSLKDQLGDNLQEKLENSMV